MLHRCRQALPSLERSLKDRKSNESFTVSGHLVILSALLLALASVQQQETHSNKHTATVFSEEAKVQIQ
jgi:hypothetical protein